MLVTTKSPAKMDEPIERSRCCWRGMDSWAQWTVWRHLTNTMDWSVRDSDVTLVRPVCFLSQFAVAYCLPLLRRTLRRIILSVLSFRLASPSSPLAIAHTPDSALRPTMHVLQMIVLYCMSGGRWLVWSWLVSWVAGRLPRMWFSSWLTFSLSKAALER